MVSRISAACLCACACGRLGFAPSSDAGPREDGAADARPVANVVFVTSTTQVTATLGVAGSDAVCAARAAAGGLPGTFVAWLSTSTQPAAQRLAGARGWQRPDGRPFADQVDDIVNGRVFYPPRLDEAGAVVPATPHVATGTAAGSAAMTCSDFVATTGTVTSGDPTLTKLFSSATTDGCGAALRLYCFQIDHQTPLAPPDATGLRRAFASSPWVPSGGLGGADARCQADATAAGVAGTFRALLATSTATAASRFDLGGPTWARVDGAVIAASPTAVMAGSLDTPLDLDASGAYSSNYPFHDMWTGAPSPTVAGTNTCGDWTGINSGEEGQDFALGALFFSDGGAASCNQTRRLYCLEQ